MSLSGPHCPVLSVGKHIKDLLTLVPSHCLPGVLHRPWIVLFPALISLSSGNFAQKKAVSLLLLTQRSLGIEVLQPLASIHLYCTVLLGELQVTASFVGYIILLPIGSDLLLPGRMGGRSRGELGFAYRAALLAATCTQLAGDQAHTNMCSACSTQQQGREMREPAAGVSGQRLTTQS